MGKLGWLKDRKRSGSTSQGSPTSKTETKVTNGEKESSLGLDQETGEMKATELKVTDLSPKCRPRSKSDRFTRPTHKQVVDVYKQVSQLLEKRAARCCLVVRGATHVILTALLLALLERKG